MSEALQNGLAIAACLAAALFVAWRAWKSLVLQGSGCGSGCGSCPSAARTSRAPAGKTLLSIDFLPAAGASPQHDTGAEKIAKS